MFVKKLRDILNQRIVEDNEDLVAAESFLTETPKPDDYEAITISGNQTGNIDIL